MMVLDEAAERSEKDTVLELDLSLRKEEAVRHHHHQPVRRFEESLSDRLSCRSDSLFSSGYLRSRLRPCFPTEKNGERKSKKS